MCGICGFISSKKREGNLIGQMSEFLQHRGPDDSGIWEEKNCHLAHRRLSIIDLSEAGHQPMVSQDGRWVMAYNGEVYNYRELREEISDIELRGQSDTEVILELWAKMGTAAVEKFNGMFAFAIWDRHKEELYLVRDRFGIKPLYYIILGEGIFFSSEIKPLLLFTKAEINKDVLYKYLSRGIYDNSNETFFKGIKKVPSSTIFYWKRGLLQSKKYWNLNNDVNSLKTKESKITLEGFNEILKDAVRLRFRSDVPVSIHLSGGTDSTSLAILSSKLWNKDYPLSSLTIQFSQDEYNEGIHAEKIASELGLDYYGCEISCDEVPELTEKTTWFLEEPFGGVPTVSYFKLNKYARSLGYIVAIEGQGGDEILSGYLTHLMAYLADIQKNNQKRYSLLLKDFSLIMKTSKEEIEKKIKAVTSKMDLSQDVTSPLFHGITSRNFSSSKDNEDSEYLKMGNLEKYRWQDLFYKKLPRVLRFNDKASMAFGREIRFPLLDYRVVAYAFALPEELKIKSGMGKYPLRSVIQDSTLNLDPFVSKRAVVTPQTEWLAGPLKSWTCDTLYQKRFFERMWIDRKKAQRYLEEFWKGEHRKNSFPIWQCLNLEIWAEMFIDSQSWKKSIEANKFKQ